MKYVGQVGSAWSLPAGVAVTIAFLLASAMFARGRKERTWAVFTAGCAVFFAFHVLGFYYFHLSVAGDPHRLVPELDLAGVLLAVTIMQWLWDRQGLYYRAAAVLMLVAGFGSAAGYVRYAWDMFPLSSDYTTHIEYRIADWLHQNQPAARTLATGSVRFWLDGWNDVTQLDGGSDQGMLNPTAEQAKYEIILGPRPEPTVLWMVATGTDFVYVSDQRSQENYKDMKFPAKLDGVLPVVYDNHEGDKIYQAPRRYPVRARVVDTQRLNAIHAPRANDDVETLRAYDDVIEKGSDAPPTLTRDGTDAMVVKARLEPGQSLLVQETYDTAWHAWSGGQPLPVRRDVLGFLVIDAPPGEREVRLEFETPLENQIGRIVTLLTLVLLFGLLAFPDRMRALFLWRKPPDSPTTN